MSIEHYIACSIVFDFFFFKLIVTEEFERNREDVSEGLGKKLLDVIDNFFVSYTFEKSVLFNIFYIYFNIKVEFMLKYSVSRIQHLFELFTMFHSLLAGIVGNCDTFIIGTFCAGTGFFCCIGP